MCSSVVESEHVLQLRSEFLKAIYWISYVLKALHLRCVQFAILAFTKSSMTAISTTSALWNPFVRCSVMNPQWTKQVYNCSEVFFYWHKISILIHITSTTHLMIIFCSKVVLFLLNSLFCKDGLQIGWL